MSITNILGSKTSSCRGFTNLLSLSLSASQMWGKTLLSNGGDGPVIGNDFAERVAIVAKWKHALALVAAAEVEGPREGPDGEIEFEDETVGPEGEYTPSWYHAEHGLLRCMPSTSRGSKPFDPTNFEPAEPSAEGPEGTEDGEDRLGGSLPGPRRV